MSATVDPMLDEEQLNDTDKEILAFMADVGGRVSPGWIADQTDNSRPYVSQRLKRFKEHGHVEKPHHGLWTLVDDPRDRDPEPAVDIETRPEPTPDRTREPLAESVDGVADVTEAAVAANDELPETVDPAAAAEAVEAVLVWLRPQGSASKSDIVRAVMAEYPLGYDAEAALEAIAAGERYRGAWWRRVIRGTLREHPAVEERGTEWRYVEGR